MNQIQPEPFAKLANLRSELKLTEQAASLGCTDPELRQVREALISAIVSFNNNRYQLGRVISTYKSRFKEEHTWVKAAKVIAEALDSSERTVYRLLQEYEYASHLPQVTVEAMLEQQIDPAAPKNAGVVEKLLQMSQPATSEQANAAVTVAHQEHVARKKQRGKNAAVKPEMIDIEEFAARIVRQFEERYRSATPETRDSEVLYVLESVVNTLRAGIRELRQFGRPALVPKPTRKAAA